ncbi:MAG: hypothetical protein M3Q92_04060, partial [Actinomycetota bacterium]|nr:hypothetical protein [Actinomycetota bacterium]
FLVEPERDDWLWALERRWEIVPVVIQDPVWEQGFPDVAGAVIPFEQVGLVRLSAGDVERRREENEERRRNLLNELRALDLDPVLISSHEPRDVLFSFLTWADQRLFTRGRA